MLQGLSHSKNTQNYSKMARWAQNFPRLRRALKGFAFGKGLERPPPDPHPVTIIHAWSGGTVAAPGDTLRPIEALATRRHRPDGLVRNDGAPEPAAAERCEFERGRGAEIALYCELGRIWWIGPACPGLCGLI